MAEGEYCKALSFLIRIAALGLSMAAAIVMATASQMVIVDIGTKPSTYSSVSYTQYHALRNFVEAGATSAVCSGAALYLFAVHADATVVSLLVVPLLDAAAQGFLLTAASAAFVVRDAIGRGGSVCDASGVFCGKVTVAAALCASAAFCVAVAAALASDAARGSSRGRCCSASSFSSHNSG